MGDIQGEHGHRPAAMDNPVGGMRIHINIEFCSGRDVSPLKETTTHENNFLYFR